MGNAPSHEGLDDEDGDALSKAMNPDNFLNWRQRANASVSEAIAEALAQPKSPSPDSIQGVAKKLVAGERLIRVTYTSRLCACDSARPEKQHAIIESICKEAMRTNLLVQVGGVLCFDEATGGILQELEGP